MRTAGRLASILTLLIAGVFGASVYALTGVLVHSLLPQRPERKGPHATRPADAVTRSFLANLATVAKQAPSNSETWSNGRIRVLSHVIDGETWRLVQASRGEETCWLLIVPHAEKEGTCGARNDVARRPIFVSAGARASNRAASGWDGYVVYGLVSRKVSSVRITLTDCSALRVTLSSRPTFWVFVPQSALMKNVLPSGFIVTLTHREVRGTLRPLGPGSASPRTRAACTPS
jgi:hypothetical protein